MLPALPYPLTGKFLNPLVVIISNSDLREAGVQDVGTMPGTVHPLVHHFRRALLAFGDVFSCRVVADPE